jgi:hypothetical protein
MDDIVIARFQLIYALNSVQSIIHDLTEDELDELIEEVTILYERYNKNTDRSK